MHRTGPGAPGRQAGDAEREHVMVLVGSHYFSGCCGPGHACRSRRRRRRTLCPLVAFLCCHYTYQRLPVSPSLSLAGTPSLTHAIKNSTDQIRISSRMTPGSLKWSGRNLVSPVFKKLFPGLHRLQGSLSLFLRPRGTFHST